MGKEEQEAGSTHASERAERTVRLDVSPEAEL